MPRSRWLRNRGEGHLWLATVSVMSRNNNKKSLLPVVAIVGAIVIEIIRRVRKGGKKK